MMAPAMERSAIASPALSPKTRATRVLLVEDDAGDAFLVRELLTEVEANVDLRVAQTIAEVRDVAPDQIDCVLLDLGLPDAQGLDALRRVLAWAPDTAVVVLTGLADRDAGDAALAEGAQDYLVKGDVDGELLVRAIRYAIERSQAARRLAAAEVARAYNARIERGLLPRLLLRDERLDWALRYVPGGDESELGGDFLDGVELQDGTLRLVIGDVCGHGADEAALGVNLRIAWRTLVLGGASQDEVLERVERLLVAERQDAESFATACDICIRPDRRTMHVRLAGHPPPLAVATTTQEVVANVGPPLGVVSGTSWPPTELVLDPGTALLLYTDGLIEGRTPDARVMGIERLTGLVAELEASDPRLALDALLERVTNLNGGPLGDDVAALWLALPDAAA